MAAPIELGLDTFGDITTGPDGKLLSDAQVLRNVVDEAVLADELGIHFIGVGEHHRADFAISAPEVLLAAIAGRTRQIHLGSAVTVLSSDDPIRVFQRFSTLDAVSNGRAEVILGRGSFTESFPLFGFNLADYEQLFEEKLDLFAQLIKPEPVTWKGRTRPPLNNQLVYPRTEKPLKVWIGVGGTPESVVRAVRYELPLMLAIIGGDPKRFQAYVDLYLRAYAQLGKPPLAIGVHSPGYVAASDLQAREEMYRRLQADARPHRRRARLAADGGERVHAGGRARLALCRLAGNGREKNRRDHEGPRRRALRPEIQRGRAAAREADELHRALRAEGHSDGAGYAGVRGAAGRRGISRLGRHRERHSLAKRSSSGGDARSSPDLFALLAMARGIVFLLYKKLKRRYFDFSGRRNTRASGPEGKKFGNKKRLFSSCNPLKRLKTDEKMLWKSLEIPSAKFGYVWKKLGKSLEPLGRFPLPRA